MRHLSTIRFEMVLALGVGFFWSASAAPKKKPAAKAPFSLGGELLPVSVMSWEVDPRNNEWETIARELRVRDLRVQDWSIAQNDKQQIKQKQRQILKLLKAAGYSVKESEWTFQVANSTITTPGFEAQRGSDVLSARWGTYYPFLYWGHQVLQTPTQKLNDALIAAAIAGEENAVGKLLQQGADPSAVDYSGISVLAIASRKPQAPTVKRLLAARKAQLDAADVNTALTIAAGADDAETIQVFLDAGITRTQIDAALLVTAQQYYTKAAELLAPRASQAGVDEALIMAAYVGEWRGSAIQHPEIVKLLLQFNPSQKALDNAMIAASYEDNARLVPVLLKAGANIETRNWEGDTILLRAANDASEYDLNFSQLLEAGADPHARDKNGNTTLMLVVADGRVSEVKLLLKRGVDPCARNKNGQNAMNWIQMRVEKLDWNSPKAKQYRAIAQLLREEISRRTK